jgi:hypothetical protein
LPRTMGHDSPMKIHKLVAGLVALLERSDTVEAHVVVDDHRPACKGNENAIPGYDNTYVPLTDSGGSDISEAPELGEIYSPGVVGPKILYTVRNGGPDFKFI